MNNVGFRLSPQQRRVCSLQQTKDRNAAWCAQCLVCISGSLDIDRLRGALYCLVRNHEILRTSFHIPQHATYPVQVIHESAVPSLRCRSLSAIASVQQRADFLDAEFADVLRRDLQSEDGNAVELTLYKYSETENYLFISFSVLCGDAVTLQNVVTELERFYHSYGDDPADKAVMVVQYADVAEVFNELIEGEDTQVGRDFWQVTNFSDTAAITIPFEKDRMADLTPQPSSIYRLTLDEQLSERLVASADPSLGNSEVFLLSCWLVLLGRLNRRDEVTTGVLFDGRTYDGMETACGLYQRYLPITCHFDPEWTILQLVDVVQEAMTQAAEWQDYFSWMPRSKSNGTLPGPGSMRPLFSTGFSWSEDASRTSRMEPMFSIIRQYDCSETFRVRLHCQARKKRIEFELLYDAHQIDEQHIQRLGRQFRRVVTQLADDPRQPLNSLNLLDEEERVLLLRDWNQTETSWSADRLLHELFEDQAVLSPNATAVMLRQECMTYGQLDARANQVASDLYQRGISSGELIGIIMEPSFEVVSAILGVLKAGGALLLLDYRSPRLRLDFILEDTQVRLVLTQHHLISRLVPDLGILEGEHYKPGSTTSLITTLSRQSRDGCLEWYVSNQVEHLGNMQQVRNSERIAEPEGLAYAIYTSGSTGRPKAVLIPHRAICNHLLWRQQAFPLGQQDRFLQKASFGFDISIWELFAPLSTGATVVLTSAGMERDIGEIVRLIIEQSVTIVHFGPAQLTLFLDHANCSQCDSLRDVFCGGEALTADLAAKFYARLSANLHHQYGPTEATVDVTIFTCPRETIPDPIPIGRPIANTAIYLLDDQLQIVPSGVVGEIYVGGVAVARGYLNRPELTADRFASNPLTGDANDRLYRTGDLARYNAEGNLIFCGRVDDQVKIRGFRIEPAEIELNLARSPQVERAVVIAQGESPVQKRLVAYLVPTLGQTLHTDALRQWLAEILPEFMIPTLFVLLDSLPLNDRGKVDRRLLPIPDMTNTLTSESEYAPPENYNQQTLADVWKSVLAIPRVGMDDNFFQIGGDSIRIIMVVLEAARRGLEFAALDLMQHQTIRQLAAFLDVNASFKTVPPPLDLLKVPPEVHSLAGDRFEDVFPASRLQEYMFQQSASDDLEMGIYHVQSSTKVTASVLCADIWVKALTELHWTHPLLRTVFLRLPATDTEGLASSKAVVQYDPTVACKLCTKSLKLYQAVLRTADPQIIRHDIRHLDSEAQEAFIDDVLVADLARPFQIDGKPPIRFCLFLISENQMEFFISNHHAIRDGWGRVLLLNQLAELYLQILRGKVSRAEPQPNSFKEFVALECERLYSDRDREFWKARLSKHVQYNLAPLDKYECETEPRHTKVVRQLNDSLLQVIFDRLHQSDFSTKSLCLSVYLRLLAEFTGNERITVGVVSNGRTERLSRPLDSLGLFWNIVPFCWRVANSLDGCPDCASPARLQQELMEIEPFVTYPLPQILEDLGTDQLFFATFNFTQFHHEKTTFANGDLQIQETRFHDKFHFPLNAVISMNPTGDRAGLRLEYDPRFFRYNTVAKLADRYVTMLDEATKYEARERI